MDAIKEAMLAEIARIIEQAKTNAGPDADGQYLDGLDDALTAIRNSL